MIGATAPARHDVDHERAKAFFDDVAAATVNEGLIAVHSNGRLASRFLRAQR
jgi:hypothetical protein